METCGSSSPSCHNYVTRLIKPEWGDIVTEDEALHLSLHLCCISFQHQQQRHTSIFGSFFIFSSSPHTGAPVVASFPHFYLAEEKYAEAIEGMSPQREHHQTFLDLNPVRNQAAGHGPGVHF